MIGFFRKDFYALASLYKKNLALVFVLYVVLTVSTGNPFFLYFLIWMLGFYSLSAISLDQSCGWDRYARTLPASPRQVVAARYLITVGFMALGAALALAVQLIALDGQQAALETVGAVPLVTAIAIKLTSPGPLIYTQERVGLHNRTFRMYKFRSMDVQSPKKERGAWTVPGDPRVTKVGKIIRKTSIDELPQLFNILKGDMSLVGPRPERPFFVEKFREEIPRYMIKHQVRPGMTGWAQINGYRGNTSIRKRIEYDLYYIENWTLGFDIKILFLTIFKGFINKNAY